MVRKQAGLYVGEFAGFIGSLSGKHSFTPEQITAHVFISLLNTNPNFDSYFLSYFTAPEFIKIWQSLIDDVIRSLEQAKIIGRVRKNYCYLKSFNNFKTFNTERMKHLARHWSYATFCHNSKYSFYNEIDRKAQEKIDKIDVTGKQYASMISFLKERAMLETVFI